MVTCFVVFQLLPCALVGAFGGDVIYVDTRAHGTNDGSSWTNACPNLQDALACAKRLPSAVEVRAAQGIYRPDQGAGLQAGDRDATFRMLNGVTIRGGYAGWGEPDPNAWDPSLYETLLWGDLQNDDDFTDPRTFYDNIHHIVTADETDATAVLEGVTIAHGADMRLNAPGGPPTGGCGIYNRAGSPAIRYCTFSSNATMTAWGAAMFNCEGAAPHLEQCTFRENRGFPVLYDRASATVLTDCRFVENNGIAVGEQTSKVQLDRCSFTDTWGTALSLEYGSHAIVSNCVFTGNHNAISGDSVLCTDSVFTGNALERGAGAVAIQTGTFLRCCFRDNSGAIGGAIYGTRLTLEDCAFVRNVAGAYGAIGCAYADIHGCLFAGNRGKGVVGAIRISEQGKLTNCTIVGNRSMLHGAVNPETAQTEMVVRNCIIRDNPCQDTYWGKELVYSGNTTVAYSCLAPPPWQLQLKPVGLIDVIPCFVDPGYWDPNGTVDDPNDDFWVEGDYHLKSQAGRWDPNSESWVKDDVTSPCIDTGDPNSPVGDEPEPNGSRINMGAYGGTTEASKSYLTEPVSKAVVADDIKGYCRVDWRNSAVPSPRSLEDATAE
jgi:predicted outer membrane repeat protein